MLGGQSLQSPSPQPRPPSTSHPTPEGRNQSAVAQEELGSLRWPQDAQPWDLGKIPNKPSAWGLGKNIPSAFLLMEQPQGTVFSHIYSQMLPQKRCPGRFKWDVAIPGVPRPAPPTQSWQQSLGSGEDRDSG